MKVIYVKLKISFTKNDCLGMVERRAVAWVGPPPREAPRITNKIIKTILLKRVLFLSTVRFMI